MIEVVKSREAQNCCRSDCSIHPLLLHGTDIWAKSGIGEGPTPIALRSVYSFDARISAFFNIAIVEHMDLLTSVILAPSTLHQGGRRRRFAVRGAFVECQCY